MTSPKLIQVVIEKIEFWECLLLFSIEPSVFMFVVKKCEHWNMGDNIFRILLYGCETWPLTLWKEHRLRVFEKKVLRRIFAPKRHERKEGLRKLHNEYLHDL
jgi:hypothetical protein